VRLAMSLLAWGLWLSSEGLSYAEDPSEAIRLEYRADTHCPAREAFVDGVRARTSRVHFVGQGEAASRTFVVEIRAGRPARGRVTVVDGTRANLTRELLTDTCEEVADALGLMVALAIDPLAVATPGSPSPPVAGPTASDGGMAPVPSASTLGPTGSPVLVVAPSPAPLSTSAASPAPKSTVRSPSLAPAAPSRVPMASTRFPSTFFGGVDFASASGVSPATLVAPSVTIGWRGTSAALWGASIRAEFLRAETGTLMVPGGRADFTWTIGRLEACAMLWPSQRVRFGVCARAEAGALDVRGSDVVAGQTQHTLWIAAGPMARAEAGVVGPLFLDFAVGPTVRVLPQRFYFRPDLTAYTVPNVGADAEFGLGVHIL